MTGFSSILQAKYLHFSYLFSDLKDIFNRNINFYSQFTVIKDNNFE